MAAMAAAGGLRATVLCNAAAPPLQLALMSAYGARVVRGGNAEAMVLDLVERGDWFPCTIFSLRETYTNPFGIEGFKTIAFEIGNNLAGCPTAFLLEWEAATVSTVSGKDFESFAIAGWLPPYPA